MNEKTGFRLRYDLQQSANSDEAEIMIYSDIVSWKWDKDDPEVTAVDFDKLLKEAKKSGASKLRLRINSPGGIVYQAVAMKTMLDMSGFEEINVDIEGLCASAATFFVCVPNAKVRIAQGSSFMIHNPWTYAWGNAAELIKTAERMQKMESDQHTMYASKCGQSEEQVKEWMDAETWFTAKEAVEAGFCDEIINAPEAAACVSAGSFELMQSLYKKTPEQYSAEFWGNTVSKPEPQQVSGKGTENTKSHNKEEKNVEIKEITAQQLQQENPELFANVLNQGVTQERTRMQEIDELTIEGYEKLAKEAKENGTSSADFIKQLVAAQKQKAKDYLKTGQPRQSLPRP